MRYAYLLLLLPCWLGCQPSLEFQTDTLILRLDQRGHLSALEDPRTHQDYLAPDTLAPLLTLRYDGQDLYPEAVDWAAETGTLTLRYPGNRTATLGLTLHPSHLRLEVRALSDTAGLDLAIWGPYPTVLADTIGETVGVVRDTAYALGLQSLQPRTLGGYPWQENDCMPQLDIFEATNPNDLSEAGKREVLYRVEAARPRSFGSSLQAYCRQRRRARLAPNWGHPTYELPALADSGVLGSAIALFGAPVAEALPTIGTIEQLEGLPHPQLDGQWAKTAPGAAAAYLILDFGEADIDRAIAYTQRAGLRYLYHPGPFRTWGHFELSPERFPRGEAGLAACVARAESAGLRVGLHTLSNFITPNDPYVTPVPDPRLARVGRAQLTATLGTTETEVPVSEGALFALRPSNNLQTVRIGTELIRYGRVSEAAPWRLLDCTRGAWGTQAQAHPEGAAADLLADHAYKVFLTDPDLTVEMAARLAQLYNRTGLRQISFDGLEGNRSTGLGNYGEVRFTQTWYDQLSPEIRAHYIADASRTSHFFWHLYSRMNWGEPWYAGFRESQTEYRLKNQPYFRRNYMPAMLGWFSLRPTTSLADVEWMLARSAGFEAGYAFVVGYETLAQNALADSILSLLGTWEAARMAGAFSPEQRAALQDISREFHLEAAGPGRWTLAEVTVGLFSYRQREKQPGEPAAEGFAFVQAGEGQPLDLLITAEGSPARAIRIAVDGYPAVELPGSLAAGEHMHLRGQALHRLDANWRVLSRHTLPVDWPALGAGPHRLEVEAQQAPGGENTRLRLEVRSLGEAVPVGAP